MAFVVRSRLAIALVSLAAASVASVSSAQVTATYSYDAQGQVKTVVRGGASTAYGYDQAGNRVLVTAPVQGLAALGGAISAQSMSANAPSNASPVAVYDGVVALRTGQSLTVDVGANDTDVDGDVLTVSSLNTANTALAVYGLAGGKLQIQAGPRSGFETITYTVSDGRGGTVTAPVSVWVTDGRPMIDSVPVALGPGATQP